MTEPEIWQVLFELVKNIDEKTDSILVIEEQIKHLVTKEECTKARAESAGLAINVNGKKIAVGAGIVAALGTAIATVLQVL